jgi:hypothetical protein
LELIKRQFFAWFDPEKREYRLSLYPADAPVRPSLQFESREDLEAIVERKRGRLMWWPPLPLGA